MTEKIFTRNFHLADSHTLTRYRETGGYSCHLMNAKGIIGHLEERLGVAPGETTPAGRITFLTVECLCVCEQAPMMQVDDRYEGNLTPEKVDHILDGLR